MRVNPFFTRNLKKTRLNSNLDASPNLESDLEQFRMADFPPPQAVELVTEISQILKRRGETIAVCEAACGGLISSYLVSVPGASEWFYGGTMVYSLKSRLKLSGWNSHDIDNYTGPSTNVALRLARNLRLELGASWTLSETGYASQAPVSTANDPEAANKTGTVYFGISGPDRDLSEVHATGSTDRCENMQSFALQGLQFLLQELHRADGPN